MHKDFLRPEITEKGLHWQVDTRDGVWFVPFTVHPAVDWLVPGKSIDPEDVPGIVQGLQPFVASKAEHWNDLGLVYGYCGRLSAPGYLDATDWTFGKTLAEVRASVKGY